MGLNKNNVSLYENLGLPCFVQTNLDSKNQKQEKIQNSLITSK